MAEVEVAGLGQDQRSEEPMLLLRERHGDRRYLAIWIGAPEATALAAAGAKAVTPRPLTHRLLLDVVEALGARLDRVSVSALVEGQFHAELTLVAPARGTVVVSARASDAVALALHVGCPIDAAESVLAEASLPAGAVTAVDAPGTDAGDTATGASESAAPTETDVEDAVERFRRDLADATPEDFRPGQERPDDELG